MPPLLAAGPVRSGPHLGSGHRPRSLRHSRRASWHRAGLGVGGAPRLGSGAPRPSVVCVFSASSPHGTAACPLSVPSPGQPLSPPVSSTTLALPQSAGRCSVVCPSLWLCQGSLGRDGTLQMCLVTPFNPAPAAGGSPVRGGDRTEALAGTAAARAQEVVGADGVQAQCGGRWRPGTGLHRSRVSLAPEGPGRMAGTRAQRRLSRRRRRKRGATG